MTTDVVFAGEKELGLENAQSILKLIQDGRGLEVVETIKKFSIEGRTSKQNPIMFALALCAKSEDLPTKRAAYGSLSEICRIPTHLFMYVWRISVSPELDFHSRSLSLRLGSSSMRTHLVRTGVELNVELYRVGTLSKMPVN